MDKATHSTRSRVARYAPLGGGALLLLMTAWMLTDPFVPSPQAAWLGPALLALAAAITAVVAVALYGWRAHLATASERRTWMLHLLFCLGYFVVLHIALSFCVPRVLHHLAGPRPATQVEAARVRESGFSRGCGTAAILPGDRLLLHRRVCSVPEPLAAALRDSGRIELRGQRSYFGIQVEDYAAAPAAAR